MISCASLCLIVRWTSKALVWSSWLLMSVCSSCSMLQCCAAESFSLLSYSSADWRVLNMYMYVRPGSGPMQNVMKLGCSDLWALTCVCFGALAKTCSIQIGTCKIVQINQNWYREKKFQTVSFGILCHAIFDVCFQRSVCVAAGSLLLEES